MTTLTLENNTRHLYQDSAVYASCHACAYLFWPTVALYVMDGSNANMKVTSFYLLAGAAMVYIIGLLDDVIEVSAKQKFWVQIFSACWLIIARLHFNNLYGLFGIWEIPYYVGMALTVIFVVAVDNAMNLIDGIDGLCSSLAIITLAGFGVMFASVGMWVYCVMIAGLMGVLVAYFYFNMFGQRRKIFMGDSGSLTIGFMLAVFCVKLSMNLPTRMPYDAGRMLIAVSFLMVPCMDVLRVMAVRKKAGKNFFTPDRNHIHHRLMDVGFTMYQTLGIIVLLDIAIVGLTALLTWVGVQPTIILAADMAVFTLFFYGLKRKK